MSGLPIDKLDDKKEPVDVEVLDNDRETVDNLPTSPLSGSPWTTTRIELWAFYLYYIVRP